MLEALLFICVLYINQAWSGYDVARKYRLLDSQWYYFMVLILCLFKISLCLSSQFWVPGRGKKSSYVGVVQC
jgi:hypothetical protein